MDNEILYRELYRLGQSDWAEKLKQEIPKILYPQSHGELADWFDLLKRLPNLETNVFDFNSDAVSVSGSKEADPDLISDAEKILRQLHPWRKGPFQIHSIYIDSEWRSNLKWDRLKHEISPLADRLVFDVGCGNGYYGWRMLGAGARMVVGIEPFLKNVLQHVAIQHFAPNHPFFVLPIGIEDVPDNLGVFDTVFSMGVLYHRRSPLDHLFKLKSFLRQGGELVLETLIIEGQEGQTLVPEDRYAKMRNVWFLPTPATISSWLRRAGFKNMLLVDVSKTSIREQRRTDWMTFESLENFLDPNDDNFTIEGLPAPRRAIFTAQKT